jgi:hypothetical protein
MDPESDSLGWMDYEAQAREFWERRFFQTHGGMEPEIQIYHKP